MAETNFWDQDAPAAAAPAQGSGGGDAWWEKDQPAAQRDLPAQVEPSTAGPGRGASADPRRLDAQPQRPQRTWSEAAKDTGVQLAEGVNTVLGAVPDLVAPDSAPAQFFRGNAESWRAQQSEPLRQRIAQADAKISAAGDDGVLEQMATAAGEYFSDPALAARFITTNLPSMIPGVAAAKVAQAAALARGASAAKAASAATTAAGATNAALNAGGARGESFEDIQRTLIEQGYSPDEAREMALSDSRVAGAVGALAGFISGRSGLERAVVGRAGAAGATRAGVGSAASELAGEQLEEVAPKVAGNVVAGQHDGRSALQDVGRTVVETAIGSGPGAAVAGGASALQARGDLRVQEERIKNLEAAGEKEVASVLRRRLDTQQAEVELEAMVDKPFATPDFQDRYRTMRRQGVKPAEASSRAGMHSGFAQLASQAGLTPRAIERAIEATAKMPLDEVPAFLERFTAGLAQRGMGEALPQGAVATTVSTVGDEAMNTAVDNIARLLGVQELPAAAGAAGAPAAAAEASIPEAGAGRGPVATVETAAAPAPAFDPGNDVRVTPEADAVHTAATSPLNDLPEPTEAQKKAGNYRVGRLRIAGLDISVENPQGSVRRGTDADGRPWETPMRDHYGYVRGTTAADGDKLDVFVKPGTTEDFRGPVFVVDQIDPRTGKLDEHKVILGADSAEEAESIYRRNYSSDWQGFGAMTALPMEAFRSWAAHGNKKQPLGEIRDGRTEEGSAARAAQASAVQDLAERQGQVQQPAEPVLPQLRGQGDQDAFGMGGELPGVPGRSGGKTEPSAHPGAEGQRRSVRSGERRVGNEEGAGAQSAQEPPADAQRGDEADRGVGRGDRVGAVDAALPRDAGRDDGRRGADDTAPARTAEAAGERGSVAETPAPAGVSASGDRFPPVAQFDGKINVGPAGVRKVVTVAPGQPTFRETNVSGLDDRMREDRQAVPWNSFVADRQELALGQGDNRGVQLVFRPDSVSGREHAKPMTGDLAGREYRTDLLAPNAVQAVTIWPADLKKARGLTRQRLAAEFDREELADGRLHFTRKGLPKAAPPDAEPITFKRNASGTVAVEGDPATIRRILEGAGITRLMTAKSGILVGKTQAAQAEKVLAKLAPKAAKAAAVTPAPAKPLMLGTTPGDAEPVTVKEGTIHVGKHQALDFDSGEPIKAPADATPEALKKALMDAGALSSRQKFFGGQEARPAESAARRGFDFSAGPPLTTTEVKAAVQEITKGWENGPKVHVVLSASQLPGDNPSGTRGLYTRDHGLWIVSGLNRDRATLAKTLAHEAIAHYGLRHMLGKDRWLRLMDNIQAGAARGDKTILALQAEVRRLYVDETGEPFLRPQLEADEIAAFAVEQAVDADGKFRPGFEWVKSVYAAVAEFLRRLGMNVPFTSSELQGMLVLAQRHLERGKRTAGGGRMVLSAAALDAKSMQARAFHGTPHDFDRFSTENIGTGEGAQAFGWGLYFAENQGVAESYRKTLAGDVRLNGKPINRMTEGPMQLFLVDMFKNRKLSGLSDEQAREQTIEWGKRPGSQTRQILGEAKIEEFVNGLSVNPGRLLEVHIPDEVVDRMLLWDKPLSEQPESVKEAVREWASAEEEPKVLMALRGVNGAERSFTGESLYRMLAEDIFKGPKIASRELDGMGIPGIRYLDGGSRNRPLRQIKREFLAELPEDAGFDEVTDLIGSGTFSAQNEAILKALADNDWLGFDYPAQALSAALSQDLANYDASPELVAAVEAAQTDATYNLVVFNDKNVEITHKDGSPVTRKEREDFLRDAEDGSAFDSPAQARGKTTSVATDKDVAGTNQDGRPAGDSTEGGSPPYLADDNGKPLVLHHGTAADFQDFDLDFDQRSVGGIWFSDSHNYAYDMAGGGWNVPPSRRRKGRVISARIRASNPKTIDILEEGNRIAAEAGFPAPQDAAEAQELLSGPYGWDGAVADMVSEAKREGHDALVLRNFDDGRAVTSTAYIVFSPEQIEQISNEPSASEGSDAFDSSAQARAAQIGTPEFQRWFSGSKVVDAEGKPLVVYHGTDEAPQAFTAGGTGRNGTEYGSGIYVTDNPAYAEKFGRAVMPLYIRAERIVNAGDIPGKLMGEAAKKWAIENGYDAIRSGKGEFDGKSAAQIVVFSPEQVKSATGNRGTFDPFDANIMRARSPSTAAAPARGTSPAPRRMSKWRDATGRLQFAPGQVLYDLIGKAADPLLSALQLKAASGPLRRALRDMKNEVRKAQETAAAVAGEANKLSGAERAMVSDIVEKELATGIVPPEHAVRLSALINDVMGKQTDELVRLGMLEEGSAERWRGQYLPRYYESKLTKKAADAWADALRRLTGRPRVMRGISGKHLRGRGLYETIPEDQLQQYEELGWQVRDPDYPPGGPSLDGTVQVWRDFTREEREKMGEIRDAGFRFVMGYMQTQRDIAMGRMFEALAADPAVSSRTATTEFTVQVPISTVEGTGAKTYGKLAGRWVSKDTLSHLSAIEEAQSEAWQMYRKGLALWKEGKTALNPVSHMNNVLSNLTMAHFAGVSYWEGHKYLAAARDLATGAQRVKEAKEAGLFGGTMSEAELMNMLPPELAKLARQQEGTVAKVGRSAFNLMTFFLRRPMGWAYQAEDTFFRYLLYRDARGRGLEPADAVDYAQRFIFTYDDLPKGARRLRDLAIPFFSYTYKAAPALLHTALTHPLRFAAPAAVLWAANAAAYAIAAGDDDDDWQESLRKYLMDPEHRKKVREQEELEREYLPPWMKGKTALQTPRTIRLGEDELTKLPLFIDVSRIVPGGDFFDMQPNAGGVPFWQPITPNNPLLSIFGAMFMNKDAFRGKDIVDSNDTTGEAAQKRLDWLWKQLSPALAAGNYHWERGMNALAQATGEPVRWLPEAIAPEAEATGMGRDGLPVQPKYAAMQTVGIKVRPIDIDTSMEIEEGMRKKMQRDIDTELRRLKRLHDKGAISDSAFDRADELARTKKDRLKDGLTVDGDER